MTSTITLFDTVRDSAQVSPKTAPVRIAALGAVCSKIAELGLDLSTYCIDAKVGNKGQMEREWQRTYPEGWADLPWVRVDLYTEEIIQAHGEEALRALKKVFGPFKALGKPPSVQLIREFEVKAPFGTCVISAALMGALKCNIVERKVVPLTHEEELNRQRQIRYYQAETERLLAQTTKDEVKYDCTPTQLTSGAKEIEG